ncbi:uncharacterized protein LOC123406563 [Hordeum vulgare subsp. vulgare]|uniref:uncharacterized protein LOC123406563 n=1 Tax=Hordeum vulgare subsp. vulgare TaxID=112509 RepID=UPI001D1A49F4|nr:uncharacterized protein LOC123406563 [Hordeum vulgare subsp. vulgare]
MYFSSSFCMFTVFFSFSDELADPSEAWRRRRDICQGKHPIQDNPHKKSILSRLLQACFLAKTSSLFVDLWTIVYFWFSTYSGRPFDTSGLNRRKRKFIWKHRSGKIKIQKLAPPFPKDHTDLLKATAPGCSYYGGREYMCDTCNALYWFQERSKGAGLTCQFTMLAVVPTKFPYLNFLICLFH